ncbi:MAG: type II secretion system F family protein [Bacillota bacterium]
MAEFRFQAMDKSGRLHEGNFTADTEAVVLETLRERGMIPIKVAKAPSVPGWLAFRPKIKPNSLALFCRQMAMVLRAGLSLMNGLNIMKTQISDRMMRKEAERMYREVQTGKALSEAMSSAESAIPPLLARMVATGEASGNLAEIFLRMSDFYEQEHNIQTRIRGAMVYPIILSVVALGLLFFVFQFLIPQIERLLSGTGAHMPMITRTIIGMADFVQENLLLMVITLGGLLFLVRYWMMTPQGRFQKDRLIAKAGILGTVSANLVTTRFARTAAIVFRSGIPLLQGLELIRQNAGNALAEQALDYAMEGVRKGESLAYHLDRAHFFDPMTIQMVRVGEETGSMDEVMGQMAEYYNKEAETGITQLLSLVEPVMLLIMGIIIGTIIVSIMLPLFDLISNMKI